MRFSDTLLRQVRDRVSIADYAGKRLTWDKRKTRPSAGDYWACCPFHQEKSSSFHVLDQKGIFNCFGCGEKGDVFTLAMKLEGLNFPEAVEKIAEYAGVPLPKDDYEDRGHDDRRKRLFAITAHVGKLYADALRSSGGAEARKYLQGRGLTPDDWERFGIGLAPDEWTWTLDKLKAEGYSIDEIIDAGVAREGFEGKPPIDTFRGRVTFEITDTSGKIIGFGGRALAKDAKAKYINSPESALYSKGRVLYRIKQAREILARTKAPGFVVGEGYLDVIAFERAGIAAVAPCGTALTEDQLQLLWRSGGEPTLCFDGDEAGKRAADRAMDLALPHLAPGRTLKIAYAPQNQDPDDIYRAGGAEALTALLDAAVPFSVAIFERELGRHGLATPEARAALQASVKAAANLITDKDTSKAYFYDLLAKANAAMRAQRPAFEPRPQGQNQGGQPQQGRAGWKKSPQILPPTQELKAHASATARPAAENFLRAAADFPRIMARYADWLDRLEIADADLDAIRTALTELADDPESHGAIDREALSLHLTRSGRERAAARISAWPKPVSAAEGADVEAEWLALVTREVVLPAIREELSELRMAAAEGDEAAFARFQGLSREAQKIEARAREAKLDDVQEDDAGGLVA